MATDVFVIEPFSLFRSISEHAFALVAERKVYAGRDLLTNRSVTFDLLANGFYGGVRTKEPVGQRLIFTQQSQEQVFSFNVWTAKLARLIPREEDNPPSLLRVSLKHKK